VKGRWLAILTALFGLALLAAPVKPGPGAVVPWQATFQAVAGPRWIDRAAQIQAESGFDPLVVSPAGAKGVAQFMDATWRHAQRMHWAPAGSSPFDPAAAIPANHGYQTWCEAFCHGFEPGLGGYNAGPGNIRKAQLVAQTLGLPGERAWLEALPRVTGVVHARETRGYILHNAANRAAIRGRLAALGLARG
jgi:hypothetical protein